MFSTLWTLDQFAECLKFRLGTLVQTTLKFDMENMCWRVNLPGIGRCFGRVQILHGEDPVVIGGVIKPEIRTTRWEWSITVIFLMQSYYELHDKMHFPIKKRKVAHFLLRLSMWETVRGQNFNFLQLDWPSIIHHCFNLSTIQIYLCLWTPGIELRSVAELVLTISNISSAQILTCFCSALRASSPSSVSSNNRRFKEQHCL